MIELGQFEAKHEEFAKRNTRVVAISIEDQELAKATQAEYPHLVIVADAERKLANAVDVIHPQAAPDGGDSVVPTTILVEGNGTIRWLFRPERVFHRATPAQVLAALDGPMPKG